MSTMPKLKNLIFEGGGARAIAHVGAISALEELGILEGVRNFAGVSAGAIVAALCACGTSSEFILKALKDEGLSSFEDNSLGIIRDTYRLLTKFGWNKGDAFSAWFQATLQKLVGVENPTFHDVQVGFGSSLIIPVTCCSSNRTIYFSTKTHGTIPIVNAVRASISIPLFFAPVPYHGQLLIDGGVKENYPIGLFDERPGAKKEDSLGFLLVSDGELAKTSPPIKNLWQFLRATTRALIDNSEIASLSACDRKRTVIIDTAGISAVDFSLTAPQIDWLFKQGYNATIIWRENYGS